MDGKTVKSQRIALRQGFSAAGKLRQGEACILPSLRGGLPSKATALPHCCSTLAWDRISTGDGRGRAWFLQSTSRPRCGRANGEETRSLPYPRSRFASEVHRGVHNRISVSSSSCYFFHIFSFFFFWAEYDRFVHVSICIPWIPVITPTILSSPRAEENARERSGAFLTRCGRTSSSVHHG